LYPVVWFEKQVENIDFDGAPHRQKGSCGILVFRQASPDAPNRAQRFELEEGEAAWQKVW